MRDHIRREANLALDAAWWLVPIAFAVAALAVVAFTGTSLPDEATVAPLPLPAALNAPEPAQQAAPAVPRRSEDAVQVSEHVQAF